MRDWPCRAKARVDVERAQRLRRVGEGLGGLACAAGLRRERAQAGAVLIARAGVLGGEIWELTEEKKQNKGRTD